MTALDCRDCGLCCVNLPSNRELGFESWIEVASGDALLERPELVAKLVFRDADGLPHLKLAPDGRCQALRGQPGFDVWCSIYADRPTPCRQVEPGGEQCLHYRREHGAGS